MATTYAPLSGDRHRHGDLVHAHPHDGDHTHAAAAHAPGPVVGEHPHDRPAGEAHGHDPGGHDHGRSREHGHSHGLIDASITRSREGLRAVGLSLAVLGLTALLQVAVYVASGSVALLADLIHNVGDAATAIPLAAAFWLRSARAERVAGAFVVLAIFVSACVAGFEALTRFVHPQDPTNLIALAAAGLVGFGGNWIASIVRRRAGRRLDSPALVADGDHARADAFVSLAVIASAFFVAVGLPIFDPIIGLAITLVILKITWDSLGTIRRG